MHHCLVILNKEMFYRACFNCPIVDVVFSGLGSDTSSGVHSHCNHVRGLPGPLAGESKVPSQWNASRISLWHYFPGLPAGMSNPDTFIGWNKFNVQSTLKLTVTLTFPQWLYGNLCISMCLFLFTLLKTNKKNSIEKHLWNVYYYYLYYYYLYYIYALMLPF